MRKRHMAKEAQCARCNSGTESINNVLFQCPLARLVWAHSAIPTPQGGILDNSLYSNLFHALNVEKEYPKDDVQSDLVPWLLWRLWKSRNEFLFQGKDYEAMSILQKAKEDAEEWRERATCEKSEVETEKTSTPLKLNPKQVWKPSPPTWLKCNSDGAWHKDRANCGLGWICKNNKGKLIWAGARAVPRLGSCIETEAEALKWAAETVVRFGYIKVIFESDSLNLIKMLNGEDQFWPILQPTLQAIYQLLSQIPEVLLRFNPRGANKAADRIAKETFTFMSNVPKLYSVEPNWLKYHVRNNISLYGEPDG
ncbi:uncharacterized protein LOC108836338 [Raphanus sativus]|uniref:Uncharacterized protein LOC108836338 n=1 Tax=Raphanus sativus TaxID=3726 RepID=A0A6J0LXQ5_RAPSA|nr:uncharacterized protein LOC108836338 [Raphanus sativus]